MNCHEVDYEIHGDDLQMVEVELDPRETVIAEAGTMNFMEDGINFEGPAPRPLERFAIRVADDGQLEVDKSRKFKEEMGQWSDTASFVQV